MSRARYKFIISDCHLSAGRYFEGRLNSHEDFFFDDEMVDLITYYSTGLFGQGPDGPVEVELVINGDFLDFLNVPVRGEFEDAVTEEIALEKLESIIAGHPKVMAALKRFAAQPGKTITYLLGNHDADLLFPKIQERITKEWDPDGAYPSAKVQVIADRDRIVYPEGLEIHHGNQFEAGSDFDLAQPFITNYVEKPILKLPWSSIYVLKVVNYLKSDRPHVDKVRPVKAFVLLGLFLDPWFTIKFCFLSGLYFFKTRFVYSPEQDAPLKNTLGILRKEAKLFQNLEREARQYLDEHPEVNTLVFGHTHYPMNKIYPDGKQYINTGTWTKTINLDWAYLGQQFRLTFAWVSITEGKVQCELRQWMGSHSPYKVFYQ